MALSTSPNHFKDAISSTIFDGLWYDSTRECTTHDLPHERGSPPTLYYTTMPSRLCPNIDTYSK